MSDEGELVEVEVSIEDMASNMIADAIVGNSLDAADVLEDMDDDDIEDVLSVAEALHRLLFPASSITSAEQLEEFIRGGIGSLINILPLIEWLAQLEPSIERQSSPRYQELEALCEHQSTQGVLMAFSGAAFVIEAIGIATKRVCGVNDLSQAEALACLDDKIGIYALLSANLIFALPLVLSCARILDVATMDDIDEAVAVEMARYAEWREDAE